MLTKNNFIISPIYIRTDFYGFTMFPLERSRKNTPFNSNVCEITLLSGRSKRRASSCYYDKEKK